MYIRLAPLEARGSVGNDGPGEEIGTTPSVLKLAKFCRIRAEGGKVEGTFLHSLGEAGLEREEKVAVPLMKPQGR